MVAFNVLVGGLLVFLFLLLLLLWTRRRFYYLAWQIGGPLGYPLLGMALKLINREKVLDTFLENEQKYGRLFVSWMGPTAFLIVTEPKITQIILKSPDCVDKSMLYDNISDGTGTGLLCSKNPEWKNHRKLINPTFNHKVLLSLVPTFNREAENLQVQFNKFVGSGEVDISNIIQKFTMNIASQTTMGQMSNSLDQYEEILDSYKCVLETMTQMICAPWLKYKFVLKMTNFYQPYTESKNKIQSFIKNQVEQRLSQRKKELYKDVLMDIQDEFETKNSKIFIDRALDLFENGEFTLKDIENEASHIVLGAFETTANTIGYVLILLAMFPKYQDRLFEEIKSIIPSKDSNIALTYEDIKEMTFMDMVLNETMRVMAPVPMIGRKLANDLTLPDGVILPQGLEILIDVFNMHRDPEIWGPGSTTFNPDNFLRANMEGKHPYAFIPFAKGLRNCLGWRYAQISLKIILSKLLRKFRFTTKFNFKDLQFVEDITIKLRKYPLLEVHLRES